MAAAAALCSQPAAAQLRITALPTSLSFGTFAAGTGGTVTVGPNDVRSKTGGVMLVSQGGFPSAAQFRVTGAPRDSYAITLPADGTVQLTNGTQSMRLDVFTSNPSGSGSLPPGQPQVLRVGARLTVGANQLPGQYHGAFTVTIEYQ